MLRLNREKISCDLKRIAVSCGEVVFVELFGRQQILKSISASIIEKRADWSVSSNGSGMAIAFNKGARYKRKIVPLSDGYAHCIVWDDDLFSERFIIAENEEDKLRAFQAWLSIISLPIPFKSNLLFVEALFEKIQGWISWNHTCVECKERLRGFIKEEENSLMIANMDYFIENEYENLAEAVESVFADFNKLNEKVA